MSIKQPRNIGFINQFGQVGQEWLRYFDRIARSTSKSDTTTVAGLPDAGVAGAGSRSFVTDANATTFASIVAGGGSNGVPVYSDGTNWRIG